MARGLLSFHHCPKTLQRSEAADGLGVSCATDEAASVEEVGSTLLEAVGLGLAEVAPASVPAAELELVAEDVPLVPTGC